MRRTIAVLTGALTIAAALPMTAAHAATAGYVTSAVNDAGHLDTLTVTFQSDVPVTSVKATLKPSRHQDAPAVQATGFTLSPAANGTQTATATLIKPTIFDDYWVTVDATDANGQKLTMRYGWQDRYDFQWLIKPKIDLSLDRRTIDVDHPNITATGSITGVWPTGETGSLGGRKFHLLTQRGYSGSPEVPATTGADGSFTATIGPETGPYNIDAEIGFSDSNNPDLAGYFTNDFPVSTVKTPARLSLQASPGRVLSGNSTTVSGLLERQHNGAWEPLADQPVTITPDYGTDTISLRTDATGRFQFTRALTNTVLYTATWQTPSVFYTTQTASIRVIVPVASSFDQVRVTYDPFGKLTVQGNLLASDSSHQDMPIALQFSPNGKDGWTTEKTITASWSNSGFYTSFYQNMSGYWRLVYSGNTLYLPVTSAVYKARRWNTRFEKFKVSPTSVGKNRTVTASGTLTRAVSMSRRTGYAGQTVEIIFRFKGKSTWYHLAWAKTDRYGRFSKSVKAYGSGYYAVEFRGGSDTFATWTDGKNYAPTARTSSGRSSATATLK
ncbi:MAG: hypothetical protein JWN52_5272 [Actinomycetia bacterium]|nr:hypothetical protein [Actinomycetes bacterium]